MCYAPLDPPDMSDGEYIQWLEAERERLEAIIDKLPKTADGVPVTPGLTVFYSYGDIVAFPMRVQEFSEWCVMDGVATAFAEGRHEDVFHLFYTTECYSTREAAEAAVEQDEAKKTEEQS